MWSEAERFVRIDSGGEDTLTTDYFPRRLSGLYTQLNEYADQLDRLVSDHHEEQLSMMATASVSSLTARMQETTSGVLRGLASSYFEDLSALSDTELTILEQLNVRDWTDVVATAWEYRRSRGRLGWSDERLIQSGYETAATGTVGRLGEVIARRICSGFGLTTAMRRAREISDAVVGHVRYVDKMHTYHSGDEFEYRQITDGAYIAIHDSQLYILGIVEVKSGRNFVELLGTRGQLIRDMRRIRNGNLVVPIGSRLSEAFAPENIIFAPETTDWYLACPSDKFRPDDYYSLDLSEIGITSYSIISLELTRDHLRTLADTLNTCLPEY